MKLQKKYIAVEGPIGVGKTSLAEILAHRLQARLVMEEIEKNPFLSDFYQDMRGRAFQTQIFFLLSRYRQQRELAQEDLFHQGMVADYLFAKDRIFARVTLDEEENKLYDQLYDVLSTRVVKPDLVIYLQATTDVLLRRIELRGRKFEINIPRDYLETLNRAYNHFFFHYRETPLFVVNTSEIDFVHRSADLEDLLAHMEKIEKGVLYYQPISTGK